MNKKDRREERGTHTHTHTHLPTLAEGSREWMQR